MKFNHDRCVSVPAFVYVVNRGFLNFGPKGLGFIDFLAIGEVGCLYLVDFLMYRA